MQDMSVLAPQSHSCAKVKHKAPIRAIKPAKPLHTRSTQSTQSKARVIHGQPTLAILFMRLCALSAILMPLLRMVTSLRPEPSRGAARDRERPRDIDLHMGHHRDTRVHATEGPVLRCMQQGLRTGLQGSKDT